MLRPHKSCQNGQIMSKANRTWKWKTGYAYLLLKFAHPEITALHPEPGDPRSKPGEFGSNPGNPTSPPYYYGGSAAVSRLLKG